MGDEEEKITLTLSDWTLEAAAEMWKSGALGSAEEADFIANEVETRRAALYQVSGTASGWLVLRAEDRELVIVAFTGKSALKLVEHIESKARALDFKSMRFHSPHRGADWFAKKLGFDLVEIRTREKVYERRF